ncbi:CHAP domain-containing protein [Actinomadura barringtoniae]|uniref:CHAP domain-containing protein n=1 Tax=Actinomadura barringtoniae TaxID=1427535 RepID=A0A939PHU0_9ACTN|nr:CHAP domain-containing protein [Actinomadura barringtoniae]MBO2449449.1 CHAP domain-containing protein [Actinomadura barringtoniae]
MLDRNTVKSASDEPNVVVGVAVGAVLAGALGLAVLNPFSADDASADAKPAAKAQGAAAAVAENKAGAAKGEAAKSAPAKVKAAKPIKAADAIKLAEKQIGISEGPGGHTKFADWYTSTNEAKLTAKRDGGNPGEYKGAEWCDMFVSWIGAQTGVKGMGWDAYTVQHANWLDKTKRWGKKAKPGALVFYSWSKGDKGSTGDIDHVGMVVKDNGNGTITTIEGNTNNKVEKKVRSKSAVVGYGYPDYDG